MHHMCMFTRTQTLNPSTLQVSYGLIDDRLSQHSLFYRTIPSTTYLNSARLSLLHHFQLYRIGILGSSQTEYKYVSAHVYTLDLNRQLK